MQEGDKQEKHEKHVLDQFVSDEEISAEAVEEISRRDVNISGHRSPFVMAKPKAEVHF